MNALNLTKDDGVKLRICPFCGGEPEMFNFAGRVTIECTSCSCVVKSDIHPSIYINHEAYQRACVRDVVILWNRRHDETPSEFERCMK